MSLGIIQAAIIDRLTVQTGLKALAVTDLDDAQARALVAPCFLVWFDGAQPSDATLDYRIVQAVARFVVLVRERNATRPHEGTAARAQVLARVQEVFAALSGWTPTGATDPMRLADVGQPDYEPPLSHIPLTFEVGTVFQA